MAGAIVSEANSQVSLSNSKDGAPQVDSEKAKPTENRPAQMKTKTMSTTVTAGAESVKDSLQPKRSRKKPVADESVSFGSRT